MRLCLFYIFGYRVFKLLDAIEFFFVSEFLLETDVQTLTVQVSIESEQMYLEQFLRALTDGRMIPHICHSAESVSVETYLHGIDPVFDIQ